MSRGGVRVRPAESVDAAELALLVRDNSSLPHTVLGRDPDGGVERLAERIRELIANRAWAVLVAVDDTAHEGGELVGVLVGRLDESGVLDLTPTMHVSHLIVARRVRRRGVGRALLAATVHLAEERGTDRIVVAASSVSREANRYFARLGFAPLVVQRVATTAGLRRSLGLSDRPSRLAALRRSRARTMSSGLPRLRA